MPITRKLGDVQQFFGAGPSLGVASPLLIGDSDADARTELPG